MLGDPQLDGSWAPGYPSSGTPSWELPGSGPIPSCRVLLSTCGAAGIAQE